MVFFKFAIVDPDVVVQSSAESSTESFFRVEDKFEPAQTINSIFLEACETVFVHLAISRERGLSSTVFRGRDKDSGGIVSITVQDPTVMWDEMVSEFLPLFNVTFVLHPKHHLVATKESGVAVPVFSLFNSVSDRKAARLAREDTERGDFLPHERREWCELWKSRSFPVEPFVEVQWTSVIKYLFEEKGVRFSESVIENKDHHIYHFIGNFCVLLRNLNKRWNKIVVLDAQIGACPVLSQFFPNSSRPYSDRDDENHVDNKGCEKLLLALASLLGSDLFNYCKLHPWPLLNNRILVFKNFLINQKRRNTQRSERNKNDLAIQLDREVLIKVNNYSFAHALTLELINQNIIGPVGTQCRAISIAFLSLPEWGILPLYPYESKNRNQRYEFYQDVVNCKPGSHFGRSFILVRRQNESDHRLIRYLISISPTADVCCPIVLKKYSDTLQIINMEISANAMVHLKTNIDDIYSEGKGIKTMTKKLQSLLNGALKSKLKSKLADEILTSGNSNSSVIIDIINVIEKPSKFKEFFKLCNDLCKRRVEGALAKRHGSQEVVSHVSTISELHRLVSNMITNIHTDKDTGEINHDEIHNKIPSLDYTRKQFCPRNQYARKSDRYYSELPYTLYSSSRTNHVRHPDFDYTQTLKMYLKEYAVENRASALFLQVDDKNKVPIGEPDRQALATERSRPTLHPVDGVGHMTLFAGGDHDAGSSRDNAVPTVTLISDIPDDASESFYQGQVYVAVKSSIMQPSTIVRAHCELSKLLLSQKLENQTVGIMLTDGGPEHNIVFASVQIALILLWRFVKFDILVVCRSCPQNSWTNEVERVMSVLNLGLYSMCFSRSRMQPEANENIENNETSIAASSELLEQKWRSSGTTCLLRERLDENVDFMSAAQKSIGGACEEITKRFLNLTWTDRNIERGYIADEYELKEFVEILNTFDPALGEFTNQKHMRPDVFSSIKIKAAYTKKDSMNDFIATHCFKSSYLFQVKAVCWANTAKEEMENGRDPDDFVGHIHPTCPFGCHRPTQRLSEFVLTSFLPCPDKDPRDKSLDAPYLSYKDAKERLRLGNKNSGDTYVPTLITVESKSKWAVPPTNTKGVEIKPYALCHVKNIHSSIRCKICGKPRGVFLVGNTRISETDKEKIKDFLENQSLNYICGTDFSEMASSIDFDKAVSRPYCATYSGNLALSCLHPVDEKVYLLNHHKKTCYHCGEDTDKPTVINQYPLCDVGLSKGWKNKSFTIIAKANRGKKAKIVDVQDADGQARDDDALPDNIDEEEMNVDENDLLGVETESNGDNHDNNDNDEDGDENDNEKGAECDLISGSKKRNKKSTKTKRGFVTQADTEFIQMHGSGDFSALPCNNYSNIALLTREDNKRKNAKAK